MFLWPKEIIRESKRSCCSFLCKGEVGSVAGAKVSWDILCRPRSEGGLGLRRLEEWSISCISRIIWFLLAGKENLWIALIKTHILKAKCFWVINQSANSSWCLRKIIKIRAMVRPMVAYQVGNGEKIYLA